MTYQTLETSASQSVPIELYEFTYLNTTLYYTSADSNVTIGSITYLSTSIARSQVVQSSEVGKNNLTLECPDNFAVSALFDPVPPDSIVTLVIKRVQYGALDTADTIIFWTGRITAVDFPPLHSTITCESVFTSIRTAGIHRVYTINCTFALYGTQCKANQSAFRYQTATNCLQTGNVFQGSSFSNFPTGYFSGGVAQWQPSNGQLINRGIKSHLGAGNSNPSIEVTYEIPNFPIGGDILTIFPGCDHSFSTCINKFSNGLNFGGFPYMTQKNPWGSASIF